jgi:hypothetical protein
MNNLPAVVERPEVAGSEPQAPAVVDMDYRIVAARPYSGPVHLPRSVVVPAGLLALAIVGAPVAVYALLVWSTHP